MWYFECLYLFVLCSLSLHGLHRLYLILILFKRSPTKQECVKPHVLHRTPNVCIQLPIYNEHNVVERLIEHVTLLKWPQDKLHIQILDDSTDHTSELIQKTIRRHQKKGLFIEHLQRSNRSGYKAGALQRGLEQTQSDLIAIFDADFVPPPDFLYQSIHLFKDPSLAFVQHRWTHLNREENLLTKLSSILLDGHFLIEHTARYRNGLIFNFNGTAGIWRKEAIISAGGWKHHTLTEDLDLSYRTALKNWKFIYLCDQKVPAELPAQIPSFKAQQLRWAKGSIQTAKHLLPKIIFSKRSLAQKREACMHLCSNLAYPLTLALVLMLPLAAAHRQSTDIELAVFGFSFICVFIFYGVTILRSTRSVSSLCLIPLTLALGAGLAVQQTGAVLSALFGNDLHFVRTPKSGARHTKYVLPRSSSTAFEFCFGLYAAGTALWLIHLELYGALPLTLLFCVGFFYLSTASFLAQKKSSPVKKSEPLSKEQIAPTS